MTRVAVIGGGASSEHEVSLASAAGVAEALVGRAEVVRLTIDRAGHWCGHDGQRLALESVVTRLAGCDVVVPMVHGPLGEDGTLAGWCELLGVPYVGSGVRAGAVAMDKWVTKLVAAGLGVATAPGRLLGLGDDLEPPAAWPVVVKPVGAGSSHGVSLVHGPQEWEPALAAAFALDDRVLVEELVVGREIDVAVMEVDGELVVSPALEIAVDGVFDTSAKYGDTSDRFTVPAQVEARDEAQLVAAARTLYRGLGCAGVARFDFFLTGRGPVLNEVNTTPGFTPASQVPRMFAAMGLAYPDLVMTLVREAIAQDVRGNRPEPALMPGDRYRRGTSDGTRASARAADRSGEQVMTS